MIEVLMMTARTGFAIGCGMQSGPSTSTSRARCCVALLCIIARREWYDNATFTVPCHIMRVFSIMICYRRYCILEDHRQQRVLVASEGPIAQRAVRKGFHVPVCRFNDTVKYMGLR